MLRSRGFATAAAIFYIFLWASAYVPSKTGVLASSPLWFLVVRFVASAAIAALIAVAAKARWPQSPSEWAWTAAFGLFANCVYLGFTYEALRHLAAGFGAIVASTNPLLLALVAPWLLGETITGRKVIGLLLGFGGVVWMMLARTGTGTAEPFDVLLALIGVAGSIASTIVFKRKLAGTDFRATTAVQLASAAVIMLPFAAIIDGMPHANWGVPLVLSFFYCVLVMSVGASILWFWLLARGEASRVTAYFFLTPVFGLLIASAFGEALTVRDLGGLIAIAAGIAIVQRS